MMDTYNYSLKPHVQTTVEKVISTEVRPLSLHESEKSINFEFKLAENEVWDINETYLHLKLKIKVEAEEDEQPDYAGIVPIQYICNTMFSQAIIKVNGCPIVINDSGTFPYKAWLEAKLAYAKSAKNSHLSTAMWIPSQTDLAMRVGAGTEFEAIGRLHFDLTHQPKPIPGGTRIEIQLTRALSPFVLHCMKKSCLLYTSPSPRDS